MKMKKKNGLIKNIEFSLLKTVFCWNENSIQTWDAKRIFLFIIVCNIKLSDHMTSMIFLHIENVTFLISTYFESFVIHNKITWYILLMKLQVHTLKHFYHSKMLNYTLVIQTTFRIHHFYKIYNGIFGKIFLEGIWIGCLWYISGYRFSNGKILFVFMIWLLFFLFCKRSYAYYFPFVHVKWFYKIVIKN